MRPGQGRRVGRAFTLRFVPAREDLATPESWGAPISTRAAIEAMPAGCMVVVDAMGVSDAGIFGDILCARMVKRGVAGLVTDGVVRDLAGVLGTGLPIWCNGVAAPPSVAGLTFVGWQQPVGCGGVAVFPNDVVVADDDGAVLIPAAMLDEVIAAAVEQERLEGWIMAQVEAGQALPGPVSAERGQPVGLSGLGRKAAVMRDPMPNSNDDDNNADAAAEASGMRKGLTSYGDAGFSLFLRKAFIKGAGYTDDGARPPGHRHRRHRQRLQPLPRQRAAADRGGQARRDAGRRPADGLPDDLDPRELRARRPACTCAT